MGKPNIPAPAATPPPIKQDSSDVSQAAEIRKKKLKKKKGREDTFLAGADSKGYQSNNSFLSGR